jgi:hypothetical protein
MQQCHFTLKPFTYIISSCLTLLTLKHSYMVHKKCQSKGKGVLNQLLQPMFGFKPWPPICCDNIDLDNVLEGISTTRATFPLWYLGLTLSVWSLRRRDFQHLEDKCVGKLPSWNGKLVNMAGRVSLVKSVIASQAIYHWTPLTILPSTLKYINKLERAFVWSAKESTTGAKCKVNWEIVCRPNLYGGLGILHIDQFATTLHLRWP